MCGTLLHGEINQRSANHNKTAGPPVDRDGTILLYPDGDPKTDAQPPFLLRYSPQLFAKEAPAVFAHDQESNRLSLVAGAQAPWLRHEHARSNKASPWLYCIDCRDRFFKTGKREHGHIPYRDKASQSLMKRMHDREIASQDPEVASQGRTEEEPEGEPDALAPETLDHADVGDVDDAPDGDADEQPEGPDGDDGEKLAVDVVDLPDTVYPTLEEYKAKWHRLLAQHSKPVPGEFSHSNLIPDPVVQLWQDCPHVAFDKLRSNDAVSRLSRCRPINGFTPAHVEDGRIRYAHNTGEINFRRRHPLQLASTLGFILNKRAGHFPGLAPEEKQALHEVLTWLRQPGHNPVCFYGQELEDFDRACKTLMTKIKQILPEGSTRARIRATSRVSKTLQDGSLGDTLGDEARGLVVLDFEGHPTKFDQMEILRDVVAQEINVLKVDVPREGGRGWKRTFSEIDTQEDLGDDWRQEISSGAKYVLEESWVKANDPHYDLAV